MLFVVSGADRSGSHRASSDSIRAVWTNGHIVPSEPVDWPEGSQLLVEPLSLLYEKVGLDESERDDSPEAIADWIKAVNAIEPFEWRGRAWHSLQE